MKDEDGRDRSTGEESGGGGGGGGREDKEEERISRRRREGRGGEEEKRKRRRRGRERGGKKRRRKKWRRAEEEEEKGFFPSLCSAGCWPDFGFLNANPPFWFPGRRTVCSLPVPGNPWWPRHGPTERFHMPGAAASQLLGPSRSHCAPGSIPFCSHFSFCPCCFCF